MCFHDFPWGARLADWDMKRLEQQDFDLRVSATHSLNTGKDTVSFALCSYWDVERVRQAYLNAGWSGGSLPLVVEKVGKLQQTHGSYGLINNLSFVVVTFKGKQSEAYWSFDVDPASRCSLWSVYPEKRRTKNKMGDDANPAEQPVGIDAKAMSHWSQPGDWVFCDGFGSGTTFVSALLVGRSCVGTEPDPVQFEAARDRLAELVRRRIEADQREFNALRREQELEAKELKLAKDQRALKMRKKKQKRTPKKGATGEDTVSESGVWFLPLSLVTFCSKRHQPRRLRLKRRRWRSNPSHSISLSLFSRTPKKPTPEQKESEEEDKEEQEVADDERRFVLLFLTAVSSEVVPSRLPVTPHLLKLWDTGAHRIWRVFALVVFISCVG